MTAPATITVVRGVLETDSTVTPIRRAAVLSILERGAVTAAQAADMLGVSKRTFFDRIASGKWAIRRIIENRKLVYYHADDLLAVLSARGVENSNTGKG